MAIDDKYEQDIQKLIDAGKEKGYLTYNEVNDLIPGDVNSPDDLDDLITTIGTQGIDILEGGPKIAIRVQELFGLKRHPAIASGKVPLAIELLSPAQRPVQTTRDLPGFWRGSYAAVRAEMRGRYPKHPWPEDPIAAAPTRRAKPRKI